MYVNRIFIIMMRLDVQTVLGIILFISDESILFQFVISFIFDETHEHSPFENIFILL